MTATKSDTTDTAARPRRAPRPRAEATPAKAVAGYDKARKEFLDRAQDWLLDRPDRQVEMPADLDAVTRLGVPCHDCGALIYRHRDAGHSVEWKRAPGQHWAAGITASCK